MPFEKKVVARQIRSMPLAAMENGTEAISTDELQLWEDGLNAMAGWQLVCVVAVPGAVIAFLQKQT